MTLPSPRPIRAALLRRLGAALFLLTAVGGGSASPVVAQDRGRDATPPQRVTLVAVGVPLQTALEGLIDRTRIALVYDNALVAGRTAFCRAERESVERALACVLRGTGLDYARLSSGTYTLFAQPEAVPRWGGLAGEVVDAETGAPLAGAHVVLVVAAEGEPSGTAANEAGRFALAPLLPGPRRLVVTHVGYRQTDVVVRVEPDATDRVAVAMEPQPVLSAPLIVSGLERRALSERLGEGRLDAGALTSAGGTLADASTPPAPTVTADVARALDAVIGVRVGEALADVHVQGGAVDEHAFLLDGAPVLVPVSLGGLVGPFSPFALSRVVVRKAGYGATHGSYLAGVVDIESAEAAPAGHALAVQVDPLSANLRWGGHAGQAAHVEGTWSLAVRQGLWGVTRPPALADRLRSWSTPDAFLIDQLGQEAPPDAPTGFPIDLNFADVHAAGRLRFGGLRSLHGSLYLARHDFGVEDVGPDNTPTDELYEDAYRWSNHTGQLGYEWVQGRRAFARVGAWSSGYRLRRPSVLANEGAEDFNDVWALGARAGLDVAASAAHTVTTVLEATRYASDVALGLLGAPGGLDGGRLRWSLAGAAEDRIALGSQTALTLGARLTWLPERQALYAEPRVALRVDGARGPLGPWALRVAVGRYLQFLTAVDVADGGPAPLLPRVRFWLPLGQEERPPEAYHLAAETIVQPAAGWETGVEAYVKHQPHLLVPDYGGTSGRPLTAADGIAYGFALHADRRTDRVRLGGAYEFAVAQRRTPGRFGGDWTPTPWSAPHRLRASADVLPLPHLTLTVRGEAVFGRAWGFRQAYYDLLEPDAQDFAPFDLGDPGAHRLPAFVQLDFSAAYTTSIHGVGVQARLGLLNALGRDNVRDWLLAFDDTMNGYVRRPRYAMPLLPVFALRISR